MDDQRIHRESGGVRFRKSRIAWSVVFCMLCVLTVAWWARSYWWNDGGFLRIPPAYHVQFSAGDGRMTLWFENKPIKRWFELESYPIAVNMRPDADNRIPWFDVGVWPRMIRVYAAHWILAVVAGSFAVLPWCPRRFSVRGLLIVMTAIAMIAGTITFVDRNF